MISANNEYIQPGHYLAIRLALQWGVFEALGDVGETEVSCKQIAEGAGADARLVGMYASSLLSFQGLFQDTYHQQLEDSSYILYMR